jgi:hypothetical protein
VIAVTQATKGQLVSKAVKVPRVLEAIAVTQVKRVKPAPLEPEASSVPPVKKPTQVILATRDKLVQTAVLAIQALQATPVTLASLEKRARPVLEARLVLGATPVLPETRAPRALRVLKVAAAQPATRDSKVQWDPVV